MNDAINVTNLPNKITFAYRASNPRRLGTACPCDCGSCVTGSPHNPMQNSEKRFLKHHNGRQARLGFSEHWSYASFALKHARSLGPPSPCVRTGLRCPRIILSARRSARGFNILGKRDSDAGTPKFGLMNSTATQCVRISCSRM